MNKTVRHLGFAVLLSCLSLSLHAGETKSKEELENEKYDKEYEEVIVYPKKFISKWEVVTFFQHFIFVFKRCELDHFKKPEWQVPLKQLVATMMESVRAKDRAKFGSLVCSPEKMQKETDAAYKYWRQYMDAWNYDIPVMGKAKSEDLYFVVLASERFSFRDTRPDDAPKPDETNDDGFQKVIYFRKIDGQYRLDPSHKDKDLEELVDNELFEKEIAYRLRSEDKSFKEWKKRTDEWKEKEKRHAEDVIRNNHLSADFTDLICSLSDEKKKGKSDKELYRLSRRLGEEMSDKLWEKRNTDSDNGKVLLEKGCLKILKKPLIFHSDGKEMKFPVLSMMQKNVNEIISQERKWEKAYPDQSPFIPKVKGMDTVEILAYTHFTVHCIDNEYLVIFALAYNSKECEKPEQAISNVSCFFVRDGDRWVGRPSEEWDKKSGGFEKTNHLEDYLIGWDSFVCDTRKVRTPCDTDSTIDEFKTGLKKRKSDKLFPIMMEPAKSLAADDARADLFDLPTYKLDEIKEFIIYTPPSKWRQAIIDAKTDPKKP